MILNMYSGVRCFWWIAEDGLRVVESGQRLTSAPAVNGEPGEPPLRRPLGVIVDGSPRVAPLHGEEAGDRGQNRYHRGHWDYDCPGDGFR